MSVVLIFTPDSGELGCYVDLMSNTQLSDFQVAKCSLDSEIREVMIMM